MKLYSLALLCAVATAQTPATKTDTAKHCMCLADSGHGCKEPKSDTKEACELVGGTWVAPKPQTPSTTHPSFIPNTDPSFIWAITLTPSADEHGCGEGWNGYYWDESVKGCAITVTFQSDSDKPLTCKITTQDATHQIVTCWYTPKPKETTK